MSHRSLLKRCWAVVLAILFFPTGALASTDGLVKLLHILKARGTISQAEYEEIVSAIEAPAAPGMAETCQETRVERSVGGQQEPLLGGPRFSVVEATQKPDTPADSAWYRRFTLRGYTQMRFTQNFDEPVEVPADRSVTDNETFILRRGRLVLSGDVTDRVSLYTQSDLSASTGAADFSLQLRDLYADVWLNGARTFRARLGQMKIPYGWVNMQSSQNRAALEATIMYTHTVKRTRTSVFPYALDRNAHRLGFQLQWNY